MAEALVACGESSPPTATEEPVVVELRSNKGKVKLCINGFIFVKVRHRENQFYWTCEEKSGTNGFKCAATAGSELIDGKHRIRYNHSEKHVHAPQASKQKVQQATCKLKELAQQTNDKPAQIISTVVSSTSKDIQPCLPSNNALRQVIKRIRQLDTEKEPKILDDFHLPDEYSVTYNGEPFGYDLKIGNERIVLFTTNENLKLLHQCLYWIMDGTFRTVPTVFRQLYTIHGDVSKDENPLLVPLVYALMSSKSEKLYRELLAKIQELAADVDISLEPSYILTDFEKAAINASCAEFPDAEHKACHFHLCQSVSRKVQGEGLVVRYGTDEDFSLLIRHIPALAFLPSSEIPSAFEALKTILPFEAESIATWFDEYYVNGIERKKGSITSKAKGRVAKKNPPSFPPELWSVFDMNEKGIGRTQNRVEAWHNRLKVLLGGDHVGVFRMINEIRKEQSTVELKIERHLRGERQEKIKKASVEKEKRLRRVIDNRDSYEVLDFLRGIAHNTTL